jgi:hypothetical protein
VKSAILANEVVVADLEVARLAFELHVLRLAADYGMLEDAIASADARIPLNHGMGRNLAVRTDLDIVLDHGVWANAHSCGN